LKHKTVRGRRISETTVESKAKIIRHLIKNVNLWDNEEVKSYIEESNWCNGRKNNVLYAYQDWCNFKGFTFKFEKYLKTRTLPYIPTEQQLDQLISSFSDKYAPFLQLAKESGFRPIEISRLTPKDFDFVQRIVNLNKPAKHSLPRQFKMSDKLTAMITPLILKTKQDERIWKAKPRHIQTNFLRIRNKVAKKFGNSHIKKISLKTFRHWKATMEYHKTKDILHVMRILGHKNIQNTLVYTHLVSFESDEYICKVAENIAEAGKLVEAGFDFVTQFEGKMLFKKRK